MRRARIESRRSGLPASAAADIGVALKTLYNELARLREAKTGEPGR